MRTYLQQVTRARWSGLNVEFVILFVLLISVGLSNAIAAERLDEEAQEGRWLFTPGRLEAGGYIGGGVSLPRERERTTLFLFLPRLGYVLWQQEWFLPGSLEVLFEPAYYAVFQGQTASVFSGSVFGKYNFATGTKLTPFVEAGAGVSYATRSVPEMGGSQFNFVLQAGLGLQYAIGRSNTLNFEWRYNHISNGDIYPPNPSLNSNLFLIGFFHLF